MEVMFGQKWVNLLQENATTTKISALCVSPGSYF